MSTNVELDFKYRSNPNLKGGEELITWKEEFSVGVTTIDEQHKKLFEIANQITDLLNNKLITDKYDNILVIIDELRNYTVEHFKAEEAYLLEHHYPKFLSHKAIHNDFIEKINSIDLAQIDNEQNKYLRDTLKFVIDWLVEHILHNDKVAIQHQ